MIINYLGPLLRKVGKLEHARQLLESAVSLIDSEPHLRIDKAATYLNYCAVLSSLNRHSQAYEFAKKGIREIEAKDEETEPSVQAIAYFNVACELEHIKKFRKSVEWYNKAIEFINGQNFS